MSSLPSPICNLRHADQYKYVWDADGDPKGYQSVAGDVDHAAGVLAVTASVIFCVFASSCAMTSAIACGSLDA